MWVFTTTGFLSLVENQDDKSTIIIRARVHSDLTIFREEYLPGPLGIPAITYHEHNDYPYRMVVPKGEVAKGIAAAVMDIDYKNFKSAVGERQGHRRAGLYARIWGVLQNLETNKNRLRNYFLRRQDDFEREIQQSLDQTIIDEPTKSTSAPREPWTPGTIRKRRP